MDWLPVVGGFSTVPPEGSNGFLVDVFYCKNLSYISLAMVVKVSSTFLEFFADTSKNGTSNCLASSVPSSYDTCLFSSKSHLFPTSNLFTFSVANLTILSKWQGTLPVNLLHPLSHIIKRFLVSDIVHDDDPVRPSVVARCKCSKSLLSCRVPLRNERVSSLTIYILIV